MLDDRSAGGQALDSSPRARTGTLAGERSGGVLAVIVVHEGVAWLGEALDALLRQTYPDLAILAVDNGSSDGSRDILLDRLGVERVLVTDGDVGFAAAVSMALDSAAAAASNAEWLLLVHDDLVLEPDAVACLVAHAATDPRLAAVGPKLVHHDDPRLLQQVGMSIDLTGRTTSGLEPDELDQGQRDHVCPVLYVSSAGMLVRRGIFDAIGRFDRRYHVFRDDLDLCWRLWLAGYDVEVVPEAVGRHVRAVTNDRRHCHVRESGRYYHAERNTLATMLKCYGPARLTAVLPLYLAVGALRLAAYVVTRRLSDAWQIVRAWGWNLRHARETWRLRAPVQAARARGDRELTPLFSRLAPQLHTYAEALADRLSGGEREVPAPQVEEDGERSWLRFVALHPVFAVVSVLMVVGVVAALPLLRPGPLRGGDLAPWPDSPLAFLRAYTSGWNDPGGMGAAGAASPAQALLGLVGLASFGSGWLAQRLVLLGPLPVAWVLTLRAGGLLTRALLPRLAAATAYVLSPPALAALTTGRIGALVAAMALPALALVGARLADVRAPAASAWRATAGAALIAAAAVAFEPTIVPILLAAVAVGLVVVAGVPASAAARRSASARILAVAAGAFVLLLPWSLSLAGAGSPVLTGFSPPEATPAPLWQWLVLTPELPGFPDLIVGVAFPAAGVLGLFLAFPRRPLLVGSLWAVVVVAALAAWAVGHSTPAAVAWSGLPLLVAALGYAGLLAAAFTSAGDVLAEHEFGWRHLASLATAAVVAVGGLGAVSYLLNDPWAAVVVGDPALPAFIEAEEEAQGPYRVLVLAEQAGTIGWDLAAPEGATMLRYGAPRPQALVRLIDRSVEDIAGGVSPAAAARLGLANVRYVYVPEGGRSALLEAALNDQFDLEPQAVEHGLVYLVQRWLPRAAYVTASEALAVARRGELPPEARPRALAPTGDDAFAGSAPGPGAVLLAEPAHPGWQARADGSELDASVDFGLMRFAIPARATHLSVSFQGQGPRTATVTLQFLAVLLAISLTLRPPRFAHESL